MMAGCKGSEFAFTHEAGNVDGALRVAILEITAEPDLIETAAVHPGQPPEGGKIGTLEQDHDGARIIRSGHRQTKTIRSGMNNPVALKRRADKPVVKTGLPLFEISVGFCRATSHNYLGKIEERKSNKCAPLYWEPLLRAPGIQDSPVPERS